MGATYILSLILIFTLLGIIPLIIVTIFGGLFAFSWTIVGSISLWRDGGDCHLLNYPLWAVAMATVITPLVLMILSCCTVKSSASK